MVSGQFRPLYSYIHIKIKVPSLKKIHPVIHITDICTLSVCILSFNFKSLLLKKG